MKPDEVLEQAAKTYRGKNKAYGENYRNVGPAMQALFPDGVLLNSPDDHERWHIFSLMIVKISRYACNWDNLGHHDSLLDLSVYAAMLAAIDEEHKQRSQTCQSSETTAEPSQTTDGKKNRTILTYADISRSTAKNGG